MDTGVSWLKVSSSYIRPTWQLLALGAEQVFSQRRERWGRRSFRGLRVYIDLRDLRESGHRSMTVSRGVFALRPGLFPALSFAQLCQNLVFLDLAILLLSVFDSRFCSLSQLSGSPHSCSLSVRNFLFCFDSFSHFCHRPLCALRSFSPIISAPDLNEWLSIYGLAHWCTPWPLNSPLHCCSARGQLQDHGPLWSFNNVLNLCQQTYASFSRSLVKVNKKKGSICCNGSAIFVLNLTCQILLFFSLNINNWQLLL